MAIPGWEFRLMGENHSRTIWQITAPSVPQIAPLTEYLDCVLQQQMGAIWICAAGDDLWLFQRDDTGYWLTRTKVRPPAASGNHYPDWLGQLLYDTASDGFGLAIFLSSRSATQVWQFLKLRFAYREPRLKEVQHGQFHILLQAPRQDILVLRQAADYIVVLLSNQPSAE
ncbi:hypothetical protein [Pseudidiomarina salinarum]|nr:hypothetical protein [Pseudidiomarina salinarum]